MLILNSKGWRGTLIFEHLYKNNLSFFYLSAFVPVLCASLVIFCRTDMIAVGLTLFIENIVRIEFSPLGPIDVRIEINYTMKTTSKNNKAQLVQTSKTLKIKPQFLCHSFRLNRL